MNLTLQILRDVLARLVRWPRGLRLDQAAEYVGVSAHTFDRHVPLNPISIGGAKVYDRKALDLWMDKQSGLVPADPLAVDWLRRLDDSESQTAGH